MKKISRRQKSKKNYPVCNELAALERQVAAPKAKTRVAPMRTILTFGNLIVAKDDKGTKGIKEKLHHWQIIVNGVVFSCLWCSLM